MLKNWQEVWIDAVVIRQTIIVEVVYPILGRFWGCCPGEMSCQSHSWTVVQSHYGGFRFIIFNVNCAIALERVDPFKGNLCNHTRETEFITSLEGWKAIAWRDVMSTLSLKSYAIALERLQIHHFKGKLCNYTRETESIPSLKGWEVIALERCRVNLILEHLYNHIRKASDSSLPR